MKENSRTRFLSCTAVRKRRRSVLEQRLGSYWNQKLAGCAGKKALRFTRADAPGPGLAQRKIVDGVA